MVCPYQEARRLLDLPSLQRQPILKKEQIQEAFRRAALKHHPDCAPSTVTTTKHHHEENDRSKSKVSGNHRHHETFCKCLDAKDLLLNQNGKNNISANQSTSSASYYHYYNAQQQRKRKSKWFYSGFPTRRLRILSVKQNLSLRLAIAVILATGSIYHDYIRHRRRQQERPIQK